MYLATRLIKHAKPGPPTKYNIGKDKIAPIPLLNQNGEKINDPSEISEDFQLRSQLDDKSKPNSSSIVQTEEACAILLSYYTGK